MTHGRLPPLEAPAQRLRDRWRDESLAAVWLHDGDWYHPAVDALAEGIAEQRDVTGAAERLGRSRAALGVGIGEALDDVACLYAVTGTPPDPQVLRAVSVGWVVGNETAPAPVGLVDPWSGLPTLDYLMLRLRETYGEAGRQEKDPATTHALVVVDVAVDQLTAFQRLARAAVMGGVMAEAFGDGHPMAVAAPGVYVALVSRDETLGPRVAELREAVERAAEERSVSAVVRRPPRVWIEGLPPSVDDVPALLGAAGAVAFAGSAGVEVEGEDRR
ncbi:hypothetical protein [Luteimicrobium sp. DT211]|uniref:hypothetical protein n=1 Tax=Luteimicrobium sp. DT211 TaxID=3393412 RepID=UPI003CE67E64